MAEEKKNIPKLRFREFTGDNANAWELRKLGDIGSVAMNKRVFKHQTSDNGEIPFFKIGTFGGKADTFISRKLFEEYKRKYPYPNKGDILLSASGSIGKIVVYTGEDEYFQDSNIVWFKHDGKINNQFLKQFYTIVKWDGLEGSTIKRLYNKNILNTNILLPAIREQEKIGTFFKHLDSLITLHQRMLDEYKTLKKTMLSKIFPKNGEKYPELRFFGFTDAWELRKLGRISDISTGKAFKSSEFDKSGEFLVVTNKEISDSKFSNKVAGDRINISDDKILNKYVLIGQNILVTMDGVNIGKVGKYTNSKAVLAQRVGRVQSKQFDFVYAVLDNQKFVNKMNVLAVGNAIKHISLSQISDYHFWLPICDVEQQKIGSFFKHLDELITLHQRELELLKTLKKTMLQQMFV